MNQLIIQKIENTRNSQIKYWKTRFAVPRDRKDIYRPKVVKKYQRDVLNLEDNMLSLSGISVFAESISRITDKLILIIRERRSRFFNSVYLFIFLDAVHYSVKEDARIVKKGLGNYSGRKKKIRNMHRRK